MSQDAYRNKAEFWRSIAAILTLVLIWQNLPNLMAFQLPDGGKPSPSSGDWLVVVTSGVSPGQRAVLDDQAFFDSIQYRHYTSPEQARWKMYADAAKGYGKNPPVAMRVQSNGNVVEVIDLPATDSGPLKEMMGK